ncbi:family 93 glycoside hydrolase [Ilyonectria robusta]|uniref:family 93 glycoside hydrolase n=1 Tax=Ilyonectria robusta TaxID=1079257 RepID=UPI001E8D2004|nr:family 93 glycoside hydrolase [Ilyonectria robusta]KAH8684051.1 family 93 glycoside hydrolase [Ilyonectria robusta]
MRVQSFLVGGLLGLLQVASCSPTPKTLPQPPSPVEKRTVPTSTFSNNVLFSPPANAGWTDPRVLYSRVIELSDGSLIATWENYSPEPPLVYFPIYKSLDGGVTWAEVGKVEDQVNSWGLRYQPFLYELPQAIGDYRAGTILLAGNSIPTDLSQTKIDVYASTDGGENWDFVSSIASGGEARPNNGLTPVWEPFLMVYNNQLVCYYADQRDANYGQKLSHQTTSDLLTWSSVVDDVHDNNNYVARPGMPVLALLPNGNYIYVYEVCGTDGCRLHYRLTSNPLNILSATAYSLVSTSGTRPVSSPSVVWSSVGGASGSIIVSSGSQSNIFVNKNLGAADSWVEYTVPQPKAYSRNLMLFREDDNLLAIIGGGHLPPSSVNQVSISVVDLTAIGV